MLEPSPSNRVVRLATAAALLLGVLLRVIPVLGSPFPLGDGGLFLVMVDDLRVGGMSLPAVTTYNTSDIPYLYPPAGLYLAAASAELLGAATIDVLRIFPLVTSVACLAAFILLARSTLHPVAAAGAALAYALMPHAFDWVVAGGGLTRGLGLLPALIAMTIAARSDGPSVRRGLLIGLFLGLSALAHPQAVVLGAIGSAVIVFPPRLSWSAWVTQNGVAAATAGLIALFWLVPATVISGVFPLAAAGHRADPVNGLIRMATMEFSGAAFMDIVTPLAVVGAVLGLLAGPRRLVVILVLVYATGPGGGDFMGAVAWSLLAGLGVHGLAALVLPSSAVGGPMGIAAAAVAMLLGVFAGLGSVIHEQSKLHAVSSEQASAMRWVADETDPATVFVVATVDTWGNDEVSEWFPAIADRESAGTVQGSEWLGAEGFQQREAVHLALVECIGAPASCYREAANRAGISDAYLFIPKGRLAGPYSAIDCCVAARSTLADAGYRVIYDGPGATIARPGD